MTTVLIDHYINTISCLRRCFQEISSRFPTTLQWFLCFICPGSLTGPLFETHCSYVEARLAQFLNWIQNKADADVGPFIKYPKSEFWAYADYKYIALLFQDFPSMFKVAWVVCHSGADYIGADFFNPFTMQFNLNDDGISLLWCNLGLLTTCVNIIRWFHSKYLVQNVPFSII